MEPRLYYNGAKTIYESIELKESLLDIFLGLPMKMDTG